MFNVTGSEILILLVLALVVVGPERLPDVARKFAKSYGELKKMSNGFQTELRDALDEPLREMRETANQIRQTIEDPVNEVVQSGNAAINGTDDNRLIDPVVAADAEEAPPFVSRVIRPSSPFDRATSSAAAPLAPSDSGASTNGDETQRVADQAGTAIDASSSPERARSALAVPTAVASVSAPGLALAPPTGGALLAPPGSSAQKYLAPPKLSDAADPAEAPVVPES